MGGDKILLVDDEESIVKALKKDLEYEGYEVMSALSGEEAVEIIEAQHFDMAVIDLSMPGMNGLAVLSAAKKNNPDSGAVVLTSGSMTSAIEVLRLGADDYLLKPCDTEELLLRIARCLKNKEALQKVAFYESILPVCRSCSSIRVDKVAEPGEEKWLQVEEYLHHKKDTDGPYTFCPECKNRTVKDMLED